MFECYFCGKETYGYDVIKKICEHHNYPVYHSYNLFSKQLVTVDFIAHRQDEFKSDEQVKFVYIMFANSLRVFSMKEKFNFNLLISDYKFITPENSNYVLEKLLKNKAFI